METRQIEFDKLRFAYITVKQFLETESRETIRSLKSRLEADLGISGDDNLELLEKFVTRFELDHKDFVYTEHFYTEGELFDGGYAIMKLLTLSIWLPLTTIELLTFNQVKLEKPDFTKRDREVSDLTFRGLLTWYLERSYYPEEEISYEVKKKYTDA